MTCEKIKNILLTESKAYIESINDRAFKDHLKNCDDCSKYYLAVNKIEESSVQIEEIQYEIDAQKISHIVTAKIQIEKESEKLTWVDKLTELLFSPLLRAVYALVVATIFVWYFHTEYTDNGKIVELENRLNIINDSRPLSLPSNSASYASLSTIINKFMGIVENADTVEQDWFLSSNYLGLLNVFIKSEVKRNVELRKLLERRNINISNGISRDELKELLNKFSEVSDLLELKQGGN